MKVLILSQYFHPENFKVNDLALELKNRGHEVAVLTGQPNYPEGKFFPGYAFLGPTREVWEGIPIYRVPLIPRGNGSRFRLILNYFSFVLMASMFGLWRLRGPFQCTFVFATSPITAALPALLYRLLTRTPVVIWVQDLWPESVSAVGALKNKLVLSSIGLLVKFIYRFSDALLIQSEGFHSNLKTYGAEARKVFYVPNWAEDFYSESNALSVRQPLPVGFLIMYAGNLGKAQALRTIVEAAQKLSDIPHLQWILIGQGSERDALLKTIRENKIKNITVLNQEPATAMPAYFAKANLLLVTLKRDPVFALTIPSKIQTYMAAGKPIVGSIDGEGRELILRSGCGQAGPAEDPDALAQIVKELSQISENQLKEMGEKGRSYYKNHFAKTAVISRIENIISHLSR